MGTTALSIIQERERIVARMTDYFRNRPGRVALFLRGSLAQGIADAWSDVDVSVVVDDEHFAQFCAERHSAPANWGQLLFNTGAMGPHMCVSHFAPLVKVDVFYYRLADLTPSPWIARGVRALLDESGMVRDLMERSAGMGFRAEPAAVSRTIDNALASVHEVVRRVQRGELAYAQRILSEVRWYIAINDDHLHDRPPTALAHFETQCDDPEVLQAIAGSHPAHDAESILAALQALLPVLRHQMAALGERFALGRSAEQDEASLSVVQRWSLPRPACRHPC